MSARKQVVAGGCVVHPFPPRQPDVTLQDQFDAFSQFDDETCERMSFNLLHAARQPGVAADMRLARLEGAFASLYVILDRAGRMP